MAFLGTTTAPFCAMRSPVTVAVKLSPTWLDRVPSDWFRLAVIDEPTGIVFAFAGVTETTSPPDEVTVACRAQAAANVVASRSALKTFISHSLHLRRPH